ncbi:hypothetical protein AX15_003851 [Amanita polypyramis BW_CC]|nr:hypothetical protein AX15_003851 [Amanita polypyramis BW_CC]
MLKIITCIVENAATGMRGRKYGVEIRFFSHKRSKKRYRIMTMVQVVQLDARMLFIITLKPGNSLQKYDAKEENKRECWELLKRTRVVALHRNKTKRINTRPRTLTTLIGTPTSPTSSASILSTTRASTGDAAIRPLPLKPTNFIDSLIASLTISAKSSDPPSLFFQLLLISHVSSASLPGLGQADRSESILVVPPDDVDTSEEVVDDLDRESDDDLDRPDVLFVSKKSVGGKMQGELQHGQRFDESWECGPYIISQIRTGLKM